MSVSRRSSRNRARHVDPQWRWATPILVTGLVLAIASGVIAYRVGGPYGERLQPDPRVRRVVNDDTGELELQITDRDGDLRFDSWAYMDGGRFTRRERDTDGDGAIDSWDYFRADGSLETMEEDTDGDGKPDLRTVFDANEEMISETPMTGISHTLDPRVQRGYYDGTRELELVIADRDVDGRVDTWTYMNGGRFAKRERDTDADGRVDTWDHFRSDGTLESMEEDADRDGVPDLRTVFDANEAIISETPIREAPFTKEEP